MIYQQVDWEAVPNLMTQNFSGYHYSKGKLMKMNFFFVFCLFSALPAAYGGSQAGGPIGAVAAGLCHSHSNAGYELQPTPQLMAMLNP